MMLEVSFMLRVVKLKTKETKGGEGEGNAVQKAIKYVRKNHQCIHW